MPARPRCSDRPARAPLRPQFDPHHQLIHFVVDEAQLLGGVTVSGGRVPSHAGQHHRWWVRQAPASRRARRTCDSPAVTRGCDLMPRAMVASVIPIDSIGSSDDGWEMRYPGGKFRCYQKIVTLMPPHRVYIETHLGGGAVIRNKRPAAENVGIDKDADVVATFRGFPENYCFIVGDAVDYLTSRSWRGDELIYSDPPYPPSTRRSACCYQHDYTEDDHQRLLCVLKSLPCRVIISSYPNELYKRELTGWRSKTFDGTSHVGRRTECLWMNYEADLLHDTRYIGWTFRGRQSWQRKVTRWRTRFGRLPKGEQQAMLDALMEAFFRSNA